MVGRRKSRYVDALRRIRIAFMLILILHTVLLIQRAVIDGIGGLYLLLMLNTITCFVTIAAIGGAKCYHEKLILLYAIWVMLWMAFNVLIVLMYTESFPLSHKTSDWLSFNIGGKSWFADNNFTCKKNTHNSTTIFNNSTSSDRDCFLMYQHIEVIQGALQIFVSLINFCLGVCMLMKLRKEEKEDHFSFIGGSGNPQRSSLKIRYIRDGYDVW